MKSIYQLLEKFRKIVSSSENSKKIIIETINKFIDFGLKESDIVSRNGIIEIKAPPIVKNEIIFKKNKISAELKERGIKFIDIR